MKWAIFHSTSALFCVFFSFIILAHNFIVFLLEINITKQKSDGKEEAEASENVWVFTSCF